MKVLLIYPPAKHEITTNVPLFEEGEDGLYPPLGLMYVAAYAKRYTEHDVEILDTQVERMDYDDIEREIRKRKPDVVGIQAMTFTLIDVILTVKITKEVDKQIRVVLGGPHVNIYPDETINIEEVDYLVLGEGEIPFAELLQNLDNVPNLKKVRGLVFKDGQEIINTGSRDLQEDLDALPFPDRRLVPYDKYYSVIAKRSPITTMMTSRGCPFKCIFCDRPHLGKLFRARSAKNVVDEMEECVNLEIKEIFLYDDTFTVGKRRTIEVCEEIIKRGFDVGWDIRARVDTIDENVLQMLKKAGCERIRYGVEAGTPEILKVLNKGITLEQVREVLKMTKDVGITTLAYFMIGSPTETEEQIMKTIDFAVKLNPDFAHFSITTPFPATKLYRLGLEKGVLSHDYWREFAASPKEDFVPELWQEHLSRKELTNLLKYAHKRFYLRGSYVMKNLLSLRSFEEFRRKVKTGLRMLKLYEVLACF